MVGVVSIVIVSFIVGVKDTPRLLGFPSLGVLPWFASGSTSLLLTIALFLGPTYERALKLSKMGSVIHRGNSFNILEFVKDFVLYQTPRTPFVPARNLIVAPLFEELVFRSCMCAILYAGGVSLSRIIFLSPLVFGLAHVHHALEAIIRFKQPWKPQLLKATLQTAYTTLFGMFAAFLLLRTGHFVAPFLSHMFCNCMGLPSLEFLFNLNYFLKSYRHVIALLFVLGIALFVCGVYVLATTANSTYLRSVYWDVERTYI